MRNRKEKINKVTKNRYITCMLVIIMVIIFLPTMISAAGNVNKMNDNEVSVTSENDIISIPITVRDYQPDAFLFEISDDYTGTGVWGNKCRVNKKLSSEGKPSFFYVKTIEADEKYQEYEEIKQNIDNIVNRVISEISRTQKNTNSMTQSERTNRIATTFKKIKRDGNSNRGTLDDAVSWYNRIKKEGLSHQTIYNSSNHRNYNYHSTCNEIDTAYRHVYYYINNFFNDLSITKSSLT